MRFVLVQAGTGDIVTSVKYDSGGSSRRAGRPFEVYITARDSHTLIISSN
jgi:hypothetical protein